MPPTPPAGKGWQRYLDTDWRLDRTPWDFYTSVERRTTGQKMKNSLLASLGRPLWRLLDAKSLDADALFHKHGLDPKLIREPRTRYPYDLLCKAWAEAVTITGNESIGLEISRFFTPLDMNALGVTFLSSANLREAFLRLDRYEQLVNTNLDFSIVESDGRMDLISVAKGVPSEAVQVVEDCRGAALVNMARLGLNNSLDPLEVSFTYPQPPSTGEHFSIFRCPLLFSQPESRISFAIADAERPFTDANRELAVSNDRFLDEMMKDLKTSNLVNQVKWAIIEDLPSGAPSEEEIARRLFVSSRTLQRRLREESTNFRTLVLEVRRELAEKYISDKSLPLAEISYLLGFSDTSSFSRAFKRWTGDAPAVFRSSL